MPPRIQQPATALQISPQTHCTSCLRRAFSSTQHPKTRQRRFMFAWLNGPGENFRHPLPSSTNYLSAYDRNGRLLRGQAEPSKPSGPDTKDTKALEEAAVEEKLEKESRDDLRPFPLNPFFISQSVLSEALRQEVWHRVQVLKKSVRQVSVEMGIEMRRVGAVVRLVEVENRIRAEGKPLALPYARAIHSMVPLTPYSPGSSNAITPHESINDLPQHPLTGTQLFYPASESSPFNRVDAGRVFSAAPRLLGAQQELWQDTRREVIGKSGNEQEVLKAADSRIPHPHLIALEKDKKDAKLGAERNTRMERFRKRLEDEALARQTAREKKAAREEAKKVRIETDRWQFVVTEVQATRSGTGEDGRGTKSPGFRYGVPSHDRKRGHVKIPTRVQV